MLCSDTGGVRSFAPKLVHSAGLRIILTSSDKKIEQMKEKYQNPPLLGVNYKNPN